MKQHKKYYWLTSILLLLFAATAQADIYLFGGLGGATSVAAWDTTVTATYQAAFQFENPPEGSSVLPYSSQANQTFSDGVGQAGLGFRILFWNWLYAGLETSILASSDDPLFEDAGSASEIRHITGAQPPVAPATVEVHSSTAVTVLDPDVNIDLKLAVKLNPYATVYVKGGVVFNELQIAAFTSYKFFNPLTPNGTSTPGKTFTSSVSDTDTQNVTGFHFGAGLEHLINRYLGIYLQYDFIDYGDISLSTVTSTTSTSSTDPKEITDPEGLKTHAMANVTEHVGTLGVVLYFGKQYK